MPLGYSALSLLAFVGEIVFSNLVFKCPCNSWNHAYGLVSLLVPASLLFLLGFLVNNSLWKQVTGYCNANAFNKGCGSQCSKRLFCLRKFLQVTFWSFFSPLTWCALALLRADIYECIEYGIPSDFMKDIYCGENDECKKELLLIPCVYSPNLNVSKDVLEEIKGYIRAESQVSVLYIYIFIYSFLLVICSFNNKRWAKIELCLATDIDKYRLHVTYINPFPAQCFFIYIAFVFSCFAFLKP